MAKKRGSEIGQRCAVCRLSVLAAIAGSAAFFSITSSAVAATVNWLDPLNYSKPRPVDIAMPDEASVTNKYYVDMDNGSGTTCSQANPCSDLNNVVGKPGTTGGPAYVYVRGTGGFYLYNVTFYGAPGKEIVIKPWGTSTAYFKTSIGGNQNITGTNAHDVIIDGGPDLKIHFVSDVYDKYSLHVEANNITIYRTQSYAPAVTSGAMLFAACGYLKCNNVKFINNEMHDCSFGGGYQCSGIYWSPGSGGGYSNAVIKNNIVRNMGGEGLEINPRVTSDNIEISGNAIHHVGYDTCGGTWNCRPGITMAIQSGDGNNGTVIRNNLIWDTASSCIWSYGGGSPAALIYNNTCYDYGKGTGSLTHPEGISGKYTPTATVRNNLIYAPNGADPFDVSFTASNNLCGSGKSCGSSNQTWSSSTVVSTDQNNASFMKLSNNSGAKDTAISVGVTVDYSGISRPQGAGYDIGAYEYGATAVGLQAPRNLRVAP